MREHRLEIVQVEQQQPFFIRDVEGDGHHPLLHVVQVHEARQQQRPHLADRGADRMPLLPEQVPELHRQGAVRPVGEADLRRARREGLMRPGSGGTGHGEAGQVALHIRDEARHPRRRKAFDDPLQGHGLAGAGRPRDQAMAIGTLQVEPLRLPAARTDEDAVRHACHPLVGVRWT